MLRKRCSDDGVVGQIQEMGKLFSVRTIVVGRERSQKNCFSLCPRRRYWAWKMSTCHTDIVSSTRAAESLERHASHVMVGAWWNHSLSILSQNAKRYKPRCCVLLPYSKDRYTLKLCLVTRFNKDKMEKNDYHDKQRCLSDQPTIYTLLIAMYKNADKMYRQMYQRVYW